MSVLNTHHRHCDGIVIDGVVSHGSRFRKYQMYTQYRTDDVTKAKIAAIRCRCRCVES